MSRIAPVSVADASAGASDVLVYVHSSFGSIPNGVRVLANSPAALAASWSFHGSLGAGPLSRSFHEQLAVQTASTNRCGDHLSGHTADLRAAGLTTEDTLRTARRAGLGDDELLEIVAVAAINTFTNCYNRLARTELDFPPVETHGREPG